MIGFRMAIQSTANCQTFNTYKKMRKYFFALGLALAALALPSCSQNEELDVTEVVKPSFELFANIDTRTVNNGLSTAWAEGDKLNVFHAVANEAEYVNDNAFTLDLENIATGRFEGSLKEELTAAESYDWFALYPYSSYVSTPAATTSGYITVGGKTQTQNGNNSMVHLAGNACPLVGVAKGVAANVSPVFTMNHASSVVKFTVKNSLEEDIKVESIYFTAPQEIVGTFYVNFVDYPAITYTGSGANFVSNVATLNVTDGAAIAPGATAEFYVAIKPFTLEAGDELNIKVSASVGEDNVVDEAVVSLDDDAVFNAGHIKNVNVNFDTKTVAVIEKLTVAEFLAKEVDATVWYELTGVISNIANTQYGNFDLVDETGSVLVYGLTATQVASNDKSFATLGLKEGDVVTLMGTRAVYGTTQQVGGPAYYVSHVASAAAPTITCDKNTVTITAEGTVYYTTNGEEPTTASTVYSAPFAITESCTVKAIAVVEGKAQSAVAVKACAYHDPNSNEPVYKTATISFADKTNRTSYTNTQQIWQQNGVTVTNDKSASTTNVGDYANPARFYKGSEIIVSTKLGNITSIEFNCNNNEYSTALASSITSGDTVSTNEKVTTVTLSDPTDSYKIASLSAKVFIDSITITYIVGEGGEDVVVKQNQALSFAKESYSVVLGEEFTAPTVEGAKTTVTYTSSNTEAATVNESTGAVTIVGVGTTTITATAAESDEYYGATASYTITVTAPTTPDQGDDNTSEGDSVTAGTTLWSENFGSYGANTTTFADNKAISGYDYSGRSGYGDNATAVTLTADASNNVRCTTSSGTNCTSGHLWFNKSVDGSLTTSAIKLYGATSLTFSHSQGTGSSLCVSEYSTDGGSTWTKLGENSGSIAKKEYNFTVPAGTESIQIRLSHPASNAKNTRVDNLTLSVK